MNLPINLSLLKSPLSQPFMPKASPLILLIDDENVIRTQIRRFLEKGSYQIIEATNGEEGIEACTRFQPDIVLLDGMMPVMDGFECCAQLQALPEADHTPVLMITSLDDQVSVDRAFAAGATDYVTKPIHWAVLRQRVRRLIQQSQLQRQLETATKLFHRLATVDALTQLANRMMLDAHLDQEWRRMMRNGEPLSLILCDVDLFKRYNDADGYGHLAGDACLRQVANAISAVAKRPGDLAARYGGEEFAVILSNTPIEGAVKVAEMIQAGVQALQLVHPNSSVSPYVTLSVGVSSVIPDRTLNFLPETLITAADKALYQAKATGRDRFCIHALS
ncbi:MAG: PleD family two-component system response regulator [Stenomitos rutilans HA7619-LM2]|jgi:diguanylate cyclase (GGDEF)-like protein|nr:PleD family two-component system response regulator [Stenomitos rutilans HA7619-LM2]